MDRKIVLGSYKAIDPMQQGRTKTKCFKEKVTDANQNESGLSQGMWTLTRHSRHQIRALSFFNLFAHPYDLGQMSRSSKGKYGSYIQDGYGPIKLDFWVVNYKYASVCTFRKWMATEWFGSRQDVEIW